MPLNKLAMTQQRLLNHLQSLLLVVMLLGISSLAGSLLLGAIGAWLALIASVVALLLAPTAGARLTLALYRARPIQAHESPALFELISQLAERAALPKVPRLYYVPSPLSNAFAVGDRQQASIAITDGLVHTLSLHELASVLAHEVAHIAQGDLRVMGLADYVSRLTGLFALAGQFILLINIPALLLGGAQLNWGALLLLMLSPHLALLAQLKLSRLREFSADLKAVELTGDPQTLAQALVHIEQASHPWQAVLFPGWGNPEPSWLRTHPATEERVHRLLSLPVDPQLMLQGPYHHRIQGPIRSKPRWYPGNFWR